MKKWFGVLFVILFFIMAAYPVYAQEGGLLYYSPQYTSLSKFKEGIAIYTVNGQLGLLDTNGKESLLRTGEYVWHGDNTVILRDGDMIYGYTYSKEKLFEFSCTAVYGIHERMIVVEVDETIGVIDFNGETVFSGGEYDMVRIKDLSAIWYSSNDVWYEYSLVNGTRKEMSYIPLVSLGDSLCIGIDTYIGLYEDDEAIVEANYSSYYIFDDKYVFVSNEGACIYDATKDSVVELAGRKILDCDEFGYTYYSILEDMVYYVTYDNSVSYEYDMPFVGVPSDEHMVICDEPYQYSYRTLSGDEATQLTWNMAYRFKEGYALCYDYVDNDKSDTQWYIINKNFEMVKTLDYDVYVDTSYPASSDFSDGYIRTIDRDTGLMGFIRLDEFDFSNNVESNSVIVTGQITSSDSDTTTTADDTITIELANTDNVYTITVTSSGINKTVDYSIENVLPGTYTMTVNKANHVEREFTVLVGSGDVTQDVKICLLGDVNGDGRVRTNDVNIVYKHATKTSEITDEYALICADVSKDGRIRVNDVNLIYKHATGSEVLW